jgi:hypothetical protein
VEHARGGACEEHSMMSMKKRKSTCRVKVRKDQHDDNDRGMRKMRKMRACIMQKDKEHKEHAS